MNGSSSTAGFSADNTFLASTNVEDENYDISSPLVKKRTNTESSYLMLPHRASHRPDHSSQLAHRLAAVERSV